MSNTFKVRAGKGRDGKSLKVFFPLSVYPAPGARNFVLEGDMAIEVDNVRFVRRRLKVGDLVIVRDDEFKKLKATEKAAAKKAAEAKKAAAVEKAAAAKADAAKAEKKG